MSTGSRENWGSRFGFIMAMAGFSIGLGNIWRFPYLVGTNGGGAFVLIYLAIVLVIGLPLFAMEVSLGRKTRMNSISGMRSLTKKGSPWVSIGWIGILAAFFILTYYIQIMGWILNYFFQAVTGALTTPGITPEQYTGMFDGLMGNTGLLAILLFICCVLIGVISSRGLEKGVETACKFMMPTLFILLIVLAIRSLTLPGAIEGLTWYLAPDFSKITPDIFLTATGQAFFSIGVSSGGAFIYGSYLAEKSNIPSDTATVVAFDTFCALLAGLMIFPAVFSLGLSPDSGYNLVFVTMSNIFANLPAGRLFASLFFLLLFFAAMSSALGYFEPIAMAIKELGKTSRVKAVAIGLAAIFVVAIPAVLAQGPWAEVSILGRNFFDFYDFLSGNIMMPLGAIMIVLYTAYIWKFEKFQEYANNGATGIAKVFSWWKPFVIGIIPVALIIMFITGVI